VNGYEKQKRKRMDSRFRGNDKEKNRKRKRMDSRFRGNDKEKQKRKRGKEKEEKKKNGFPLSRE